jgi:hypothetical protein
MNSTTMFQDLAALSQELNEASDDLAEQIAQAEKALNALKLGVTAWATISSWPSGPYGASEGCSIGYGKHNGKWGLKYLTWSDDFPESDHSIPLREAAREDRISAIEKLPDLVKALEKRAREIKTDARNQTTQLKETVSALRALTQ